MEKIVSGFLDYLNVPISKRYFEKLLLSHPNYPSLLSIADGLERLGIKYKAAKIEKNQISQIEFPYLLTLSTEQLLVIKSEKDLSQHKDSLKYFDGVFLKIEPTTIIMDEENNKDLIQSKKIKYLSWTLIFTFSIILSTLFYKNFYEHLPFLIVTSLIGISIGYILIAKDIGVKYDVIEEFCSDKKTTNCDAILQSGGSKFWFLSLSDSTFIYFIFQFLIVLLSTFNFLRNDCISILTLLSFFTIPVILFSVYYQMVVARVWCKLCLTVDFLLGIQFVYLLLNSKIVFSPSFAWHASVLSILFLLVGSIVILSKIKFEEFKKSERSEVLANRIKNSDDIFSKILFQQPRILNTVFEKEMHIGDTNAPIQLIMVSNLYCKPCMENHEKVRKLVQNYPDKINLIFRFVRRGSEVDDNIKPKTTQYIIQYWLKNIYKTENESLKTEQLIHDWFKTMDLKKFKSKYPLEYSYNDLSEEVEANHVAWIHENKILETPTYFLNTYKFPKNYLISDLHALIPALVAHLKPIKFFREIERRGV